MPKVPYAPVPTASPDPSGTPGLSLSTPGAAFGENIGAAISHLGKTVEGAGNELFSRAVALQQLNNETEAKEADAKYMVDVGNLHAQFSTLQGQDAVKAFPKYAEDMQKLRKDMRAGLSNDMARRMFDSSSLSTMGRSIFNGAGHAATENKKYAVNTATAQMDLDIKTVEDNPKDESLFQDKLGRVRANAAQIAALHGMDQGSAQEKDLALKATSQLWSQRIIGLSRTEPYEAVKVLEANKTQLTGQDYLKVDNAVRAQGRAVGSVNIANEVYNAGRGSDDKPAKSLSTLEAEAKAKAEAMDPNDPILAQHAVAAVRGIYNQDKYARRQEEVENQQVVAGAIQQGVADERQLRMNPKVAAALDALPKDKQLAIPGAINRYNAARDKVTNQTNEQRLYGLSNNDVEAFLNTDVTKESLSQVDMRKFQKLQEKLKAQANQDPRVNRAISQMRGALGSQMQALGIYGRTTANHDEYDHFTGAMQLALDVWREAYGKPATDRDVVETIGPQVIQQRAEPGWLWGTNKKPFYEQTVPPKWSENLKADVVAKGGIEPTDEQVYRAYVRSQFIKLYKKAQPSE